MINGISNHEYWTEIASLAQSITAEVIANDEGTDALHDALHETIDGHQWVIYTSRNFDVAKHSPNDDAWTDCYGGGDVPENFDAVRAYYAMERDVSEHSDFGQCAKCEEQIDECTCDDDDEATQAAAETTGDAASKGQIVTFTDERYRDPIGIALRLYVESNGDRVAVRRINLGAAARCCDEDCIVGAVWRDSTCVLGVCASTGIETFATEFGLKVALDLVGTCREMLDVGSS